jgi:cytochrome c-type biogenesis protein CcmH
MVSLALNTVHTLKTMKSKRLEVINVSLLTIILVGIFVLSPWQAKVRAQSPMTSDDEVNQIARQLYCPVCENVPLDECQIAACDQWRELIRQQLNDGWTEDEIKSFFVAQYGDRVLGEPPRRGSHWLLYVLPPVIFLVGLGLLFSKLNRKPQIQNEIINGNEDPYLQKVEQDLNNMDDG